METALLALPERIHLHEVRPLAEHGAHSFDLAALDRSDKAAHGVTVDESFKLRPTVEAIRAGKRQPSRQGAQLQLGVRMSCSEKCPRKSTTEIEIMLRLKRTGPIRSWRTLAGLY